jgi:hypothetical protein
MPKDITLQVTIRADGSTAVSHIKQVDQALDGVDGSAKQAASGLKQTASGAESAGDAMSALGAAIAAIGAARLVAEFAQANIALQGQQQALEALAGSKGRAGLPLTGLNMATTYYRDADEAEAAGKADFYRSGIYREGLIGGPDCPPEYRGDGRPQWTPSPANQAAPGSLY